MLTKFLLFVTLSFIPLLISFSGNLQYTGFFQLRFDYGDLLKNTRGYSEREDLYLKKFEFKNTYKVNKKLKLVSKFALNNWFKNYSRESQKDTPYTVKVKKLFLLLRLNKGLSIQLGRDKKPYSGEGLASSTKLLLIDKSFLFKKIKKSFGDYYGEQLQITLKQPKSGIKLSIATAYTWSFRKYNPLKKKFSVSTERKWLNNLFLRLEFNPIEGDTKSLNTFGGRTLNFGLSYGYAEDMELKTSDGVYDGVAHLSEVDFLFRSPKTDKGIFTLYGEADRMKYLIGGSNKNYSVEDFHVQGGYRPPFSISAAKLEVGLGFEKYDIHPKSKSDYAYEGAINLYLPKRIKLSFGISDKISDGEGSDIYSLQCQWIF
jgi:hypothetical protein